MPVKVHELHLDKGRVSRKPFGQRFWQTFWTHLTYVYTLSWLFLSISHDLLVFHRKDLCEVTSKTQSVFKFSDVLFALSQMDPHSWGFRSGWHLWQIFRSGWPLVRCTPQDQALGQIDIFVRSLGQADLYSDVPPMRLWVRLIFHQTVLARLLVFSHSISY